MSCKTIQCLIGNSLLKWRVLRSVVNIVVMFIFNIYKHASMFIKPPYPSDNYFHLLGFMASFLTLKLIRVVMVSQYICMPGSVTLRLSQRTASSHSEVQL